MNYKTLIKAVLILIIFMISAISIGFILYFAPIVIICMLIFMLIYVLYNLLENEKF